MASEPHCLPDDELARRVWADGDGGCFERLFTRHRKRVFLACRSFFGDSSAAEDATQETFLRAYRSIAVFKGGDFAGWVLHIARNVCIDEWRKSRRQTSLDDGNLAEKPPAGYSTASLELRLVADCVREELRLLPNEQRVCLELRIEGYSYEETSARTGLPVNAVKSHIQNGRRMLWRKLEPALPRSLKG